MFYISDFITSEISIFRVWVSGRRRVHILYRGGMRVNGISTVFEACEYRVRHNTIGFIAWKYYDLCNKRVPAVLIECPSKCHPNLRSFIPVSQFYIR